MNERLGQLVMLHLGEAVIGFAATPLESTPQQFIAVALAATLVWSLHLNYYHVEADKHSHAYRQSRFRGLLFFYCHWLLLVALLLTGSGLRLLLGEFLLFALAGTLHVQRHDPPTWHSMFARLPVTDLQGSCCIGCHSWHLVIQRHDVFVDASHSTDGRSS
jgi:hypothetical protein